MKEQNIEDFLTVRFIGSELNERNVPIYELSRMLTSIQRIIDKTFYWRMHDYAELQKKPTLSHVQKDHTALQLSSHKEGSDVYGFIPFRIDPDHLPDWEPMMNDVLSGIELFTFKDHGSKAIQIPSGIDQFVTNEKLEEQRGISERSRLKDLLYNHFDPAELEELCFDLDINFDDVNGKRIKTTIMNLIKYTERHDRYADLIRYLNKKRPTVDWINKNVVPPPNRKYILLAPVIFSEIQELHNGIDNYSKIEAIEISSPQYAPKVTYVMNSATKSLSKALDKQRVPGEFCEIEGRASTLYLAYNSFEMTSEETRNKIRVYASSDDLIKIKQHPDKRPRIKVTGKSLHQFGSESFRIEEIEATKVFVL